MTCPWVQAWRLTTSFARPRGRKSLTSNMRSSRQHYIALTNAPRKTPWSANATWEMHASTTMNSLTDGSIIFSREKTTTCSKPCQGQVLHHGSEQVANFRHMAAQRRTADDSLSNQRRQGQYFKGRWRAGIRTAGWGRS